MSRLTGASLAGLAAGVACAIPRGVTSVGAATGAFTFGLATNSVCVGAGAEGA